MISVVIPTHNRADLLPRAIESAQKQTYRDIEIIVVSDGSTDDTDSVVEKIKAEDNRIKYCPYSPGHGGNYARNYGVEQAGGEYVAFLDDDDEWLPTKLEKQLNLFEADSNMVLAYTGVNVIYVNEKINYSFIPKDQGDLSRKVLLGNCIGSTSTAMVKKSVFEKSGVFDNDLDALQDFDLWIRVVQHGTVGVVSEELINYYNYRGTKQVSAVTSKYERAFDYINNKYKDMFASLSEKEAKQKRISEYTLLGNKAIRNRDGKTARRYYKKLLRTQFSPKHLIFYLLGFTNYELILRLRNLI